MAWSVTPVFGQRSAPRALVGVAHAVEALVGGAHELGDALGVGVAHGNGRGGARRSRRLRETRVERLSRDAISVTGTGIPW